MEFSIDKIKSFITKNKKRIKQFKGKVNVTKSKWSNEEDKLNVYGATPSLETFFDLDKNVLLKHFWTIVNINDVVVGRISFINDSGLFVTLLCFDGDKCMNIDHLQIDAFCSKEEMKKHSLFENPLKNFTKGELVKGVVVDLNPSNEDIFLSFLEQPKNNDVRLGVIDEDDLPPTYKRSLSAQESYNEILSLSVGFYNPHVVDFLSKKLITNNHCSFFDDLNDMKFPSSEYAEYLRKRQSNKVAEKHVKLGAEFCRDGRTMEALGEMNKALKIDSTNVDALVGKGAIYANSNTYFKAIECFEEAIKYDKHHKNANQYLLETLIQRGKSIESKAINDKDYLQAKSMYEKALEYKPNHQAALYANENIKKLIAQRYQNEKLKEEQIKQELEDRKSESMLKVKQLLEGSFTKKIKKKSKKRKRSKSSSSSDSSSESSSSSDSEPRRKKRKKSSKHKKKKIRAKSKKLKKKRHLSSGNSHEGSGDFDRKQKYSTRSPSPNKKTIVKSRTPSTSNSFHNDSKYKQESYHENNKRASSIFKPDKSNLNTILEEISKFQTKKK